MTSFNWSDRSVVVTGGTGFIGSHLVDELLAAGARVVCLHRSSVTDTPQHPRLQMARVDLLDAEDLRALFKYVSPRVNTVVHCAGLDGNSKFKIDQAAHILDVNLRITSNVLNAARDFELERLVMLSSAEIYSANAAAPIGEEDDYRKHLEYSENGYVLSKTLAEVMIALYRKQYGMNIQVVRPTNTYGSRDKLDSATGRVVPVMIHKILSSEQLEIWGDGSQRRSFVYVKDLAAAILKMIETDSVQTLNVASKQDVSILELAEMICAIADVPQRINVDATKPTGAHGRQLSLDKLDKLVDLRFRSLEEGLTETIRWYKDAKKGSVIDLRQQSPTSTS